MFSGILRHIDKVKFLINDNSSTILSAAGVVGTISTAVLATKASFEASERINNKKKDLTEKYEAITKPQPEVDPEVQNYFYHGLTRTDKVKLVWPLYIPTAVTVTATVGCIVFAHRIDAKKIAALTAAASISRRELQEYKDKVVEKLGPKQDEKIRNEVAQDRVTKDGSSELVIVNEGKVLCKEGMSGRYFESTNEDLKRAENWVNHQLNRHMDCSLSEFYGQIGLESTSYSDAVGWSAADSLELDITTALTPDGRPCLFVDFHPHPGPSYTKNHEH